MTPLRKPRFHSKFKQILVLENVSTLMMEPVDLHKSLQPRLITQEKFFRPEKLTTVGQNLLRGYNLLFLKAEWWNKTKKASILCGL